MPRKQSSTRRRSRKRGSTRRRSRKQGSLRSREKRGSRRYRGTGSDDDVFFYRQFSLELLEIFIEDVYHERLEDYDFRIIQAALHVLRLLMFPETSDTQKLFSQLTGSDPSTERLSLIAQLCVWTACKVFTTEDTLRAHIVFRSGISNEFEMQTAALVANLPYQFAYDTSPIKWLPNYVPKNAHVYSTILMIFRPDLDPRLNAYITCEHVEHPIQWKSEWGDSPANLNDDVASAKAILKDYSRLARLLDSVLGRRVFYETIPNFVVEAEDGSHIGIKPAELRVSARRLIDIIGAQVTKANPKQGGQGYDWFIHSDMDESTLQSLKEYTATQIVDKFRLVANRQA